MRLLNVFSSLGLLAISAEASRAELPGSNSRNSALILAQSAAMDLSSLASAIAAGGTSMSDLNTTRGYYTASYMVFQDLSATLSEYFSADRMVSLAPNAEPKPEGLFVSKDEALGYVQQAQMLLQSISQDVVAGEKSKAMGEAMGLYGRYAGLYNYVYAET